MRKVLLWYVLALVLLLIAGGSIWWYWYRKPTNTVSPSLVEQVHIVAAAQMQNASYHINKATLTLQNGRGTLNNENYVLQTDHLAVGTITEGEEVAAITTLERTSDQQVYLVGLLSQNDTYTTYRVLQPIVVGKNILIEGIRIDKKSIVLSVTQSGKRSQQSYVLKKMQLVPLTNQ